jgi:hypothetical protein
MRQTQNSKPHRHKAALCGIWFASSTEQTTPARDGSLLDQLDWVGKH